jgi:methylated-DNA-[protein]-cysteine S-methyltransferase
MEMKSPVGTLLLTANEAALTGIYFEGEGAVVGASWQMNANHPVLATAQAQLREYFAGRRKHFDLALAAAGTDFQRCVWKALETIPWGETQSYGALARKIGKPRAMRAVGAANGANPIPIVVPCHRVIGANGTLTGYGGGLWRKQKLLALEGHSNLCERVRRSGGPRRESGA